MVDKKCKPIECNGEKCKDCSYCSKREFNNLKSEIEELKSETKRLKELCGKLKLLLTIDSNKWRYGLLLGLIIVALASTIVDILMKIS